MSLKLNLIIIAGNLTRDPEMKYLPSGSAICEIQIANNYPTAKKGGEKQQDTTFIKCVFFGKTAEFVGEWFKKGREIIVTGRIKLETWEDKKDGGKRERIVIMAEKAEFGTSAKNAEDAGESPRSEPRQSSGGQTTDDLPF